MISDNELAKKMPHSTRMFLLSDAQGRCAEGNGNAAQPTISDDIG
jgi:hypothetical protein